MALLQDLVVAVEIEVPRPADEHHDHRLRTVFGRPCGYIDGGGDGVARLRSDQEALGLQEQPTRFQRWPFVERHGVKPSVVEWGRSDSETWEPIVDPVSCKQALEKQQLLQRGPSRVRKDRRTQ